MAGRASVYANEEIIKLASEKFVPVAGDNWYRRRRKDAEGIFFSKLVEQAPRNRPGRRTHQGTYCFTADGKLLTYRNHRYPSVMLRELQKALFEWEKLPAEQRKPGAIQVEERGAPDPKYHRELPPGGLVVNVFMRVLDKKDGEYCQGTSIHPGGTFAARDHIWLTKDEWQALIPADARPGDDVKIPDRVRNRILCYHLVEHTRGHNYAWRPREIRSQKMRLTVKEASETRLKLRLEGNALMASDANVKASDIGFDVAFLGYIESDRVRGKITRFDFVAIGLHWGEGRYNRGARPGRTPVGIAYELASDDDPSRNVPPQGTTSLRNYFQGN